MTSVITTASGYWETREVISGLSAKRGAAPGGLPLRNALRRYQVRRGGSGNAKGVYLEGTPWGHALWARLGGTSRRYTFGATSRGYSVKVCLKDTLWRYTLGARPRGMPWGSSLLWLLLLTEASVVMTDVMARFLLWFLGTSVDFCCSATRVKVGKQVVH